jgi:hypothetical protein
MFMNSISQEKTIMELFCDTRTHTPLEDNIAFVAAAGSGRVADVDRVAQGLIDRGSLDPTALDFARLVSPCSRFVYEYLERVSRTSTPPPVRFEASPRKTPIERTPSTPSEKNREIIALAISGNIEALKKMVADLKDELDLEAVKIAQGFPLTDQVEAYLASLSS